MRRVDCFRDPWNVYQLATQSCFFEVKQSSPEVTGFCVSRLSFLGMLGSTFSKPVLPSASAKMLNGSCTGASWL